MDQVSAERSSTSAPSMLFEAMAGVGAIVLAILGLTQILPHYMAAIGTVVVGAALVEGSALGVRSRRVTSALRGQPSAEVIAGAAGVVLGVLALLGMSELVLLPAAVIVFGASLLIAGFSAPRTAIGQSRRASAEAESDTLGPDDTIARAIEPARTYAGRSEARQVARETRETDELIESPTGAQLLVGLAAVVLGILALLGHSPLILTLVALLCVGCMELLSGAVLGA